MHTVTWTKTQQWGTIKEVNIFVVNHVSLMVIMNMENIEQGRPIEFIRHRRESQGYAKV
jgi:hypothetical protein